MAFDPESRLVVSVVPGARSAENVAAVVQDFRKRTGGRVMNLITTDGYSAYEEAILNADYRGGKSTNTFSRVIPFRHK